MRSIPARYRARVRRANDANRWNDAALLVATFAHRDAVDRAGVPYLDHVLTVAETAWDATGSESVEAVAFLHDVVEDTPVELFDLPALGFPPHIVEAVDAVTRRAEETYAAFINRITRNPIAVSVKRADIAHHLSRPPVADSLTTRYLTAAATLANAVGWEDDRKDTT